MYLPISFARIWRDCLALVGFLCGGVWLVYVSICPDTLAISYFWKIVDKPQNML